MFADDVRVPEQVTTLDGLDLSLYAGDEIVRLTATPLTNDTILVSWSHAPYYQSYSAVYGVIVDSTGAAISDVIAMENGSTKYQITPLVDGGFVYSGEGAEIEVFSASGQSLAIDGASLNNMVGNVTVAPLSGGGFIMVNVYEASFGERLAVQRYDAEGARVGALMTAETTVRDYYLASALTLDNDVVVLAYLQGGTVSLYTLAGAFDPETDLIQVDRPDGEYMSQFSLAATSSGFVVSWMEQVGNDFQVMMQQFTADGTKSGDAEVISTDVGTWQDGDSVTRAAELSLVSIDNGGYAISWGGASDLHVAEYDGASTLVSQTTHATVSDFNGSAQFTSGGGLVAWAAEGSDTVSFDLVTFEQSDANPQNGGGDDPVQYRDSYGVIDGANITHAFTQFDTDTFDVQGGEALRIEYARTLKAFSVDGNDFIVVVGGESSTSIFAVASDGTLSFTDRVSINETFDVEVVEVGGTVFIIAADVDERGIFAFSVSADGTLTETSSLDDTNLPSDQWAAGTAVTSAEIGGETYIFSVRPYMTAISSFTLDAQGQLAIVDVKTDHGTTQSTAGMELEVGQLGGKTFVFAPVVADHLINVYEVSDDGTLTLVETATDTGDLALRSAFGVEVVTVGQSMYLYVSGYADDGLTVFSVGADGSLSHLQTIFDDATTEIFGPATLTSAVLEGQPYLFVAGADDNGVAVFAIGEDGLLTSETNITDDDDIALGFAYGLEVFSTSEGGDAFLAVSSFTDQGGITLFNLNKALSDEAPIEGPVKLIGTEGDDLLSGGAFDDTIRGGEGNDTMTGGEGADQIWAGPGDTGDDNINGGAGNDIMAGGAGNDLIVGSTGADVGYGGVGDDTLIGGVSRNSSETASNRLWAGGGNDLVYGAAGRDALGGGDGDDEIHGGGGNDLIYAGKTGADSLYGDGGNDIVFGGSENDVVDGGAGADELYGGSGDDQVSGGAGADTLYGGTGDDTLTGGVGDDTLRPGAGLDVLVFAAGDGADRVGGFTTGEDTLDLSATTTDFTDLASVQAATTGTADGVLIDLGGGDSVLLLGLALSDLEDVGFIF